MIGEGSYVSFELGTDQKSGKPRALNIAVSGSAFPVCGFGGGDLGTYFPQSGRSGFSNPPSMAGGMYLGDQHLSGMVVQWRENWGWVKCAQLEGNIFAHEHDVISGVLAKNVPVSFDLGADLATGKPRALNIEAHNIFPQPFMPTSTSMCAGGKGDSSSSGGLDPNCRRYNGTVKSWKDQWGWIECQQTQGGDVFAHSTDVMHGSIVVGMPVTFSVGTDAKGRQRAMQIIAGGTGSTGGVTYNGGGSKASGWNYGYGGVGCGNVFSFYNGKCGCLQSSIGKGSFKGGCGSMQVSADLSIYDGQHLEGQITSWRDQWGWIGSPSFPAGAEIFAHTGDCLDFVPEKGQWVEFTVGRDDKGRFRAQQIQTSMGVQPKKRKAAVLDGVVDGYRGGELAIEAEAYRIGALEGL